MSASVVGRSARLRRKSSVIQQMSSPVSIGLAGGRESAVIAVLHRLYRELSAGPCTEEVARTLLKVMSENWQELEAHYHDLMLGVMCLVYHHLLLAKDVMVRLLLLQLVELRARSWRSDSSADQFYASHRSVLADQQGKCQLANGGCAVKQGRGIVKTSNQPNSQCRKVVGAAPDIQRPAAVPPGSTSAHRSRMLDQLMYTARTQMTTSFEEAMKKLGCHAVVKTPYAAASSAMHSNHVSNTGKELWQSLAQATSQKRSPSCMKPLDGSGGAKPSSNEIADSTADVSLISESVTKAGSESGDSSSCSSATPVAKRARDQTLESGAGDAKSIRSSELVTVNGGWAGWQTADDRKKPTKGESFEEDISGVPMDAEPLDSSSLVSGEESFYSVNSCDQHPVTESSTVAEPGDDHDDDDDDDSEGDRGDVGDGAAYVDDTPAENGMPVKSLLKYDRVFLIKCARRVDARFLQPNWAKLCSQFKDVCLSPQDARPIQLSVDAPLRWTLFRAGRYT